jgi:hypothetical protein
LAEKGQMEEKAKTDLKRDLATFLRLQATEGDGQSEL